MKIKLLVVILLMTGISAFGQTKKIFYGVSVSADWNSYLLVGDGAVDYKSRPNFSAGVMVRYNWSERFLGNIGIHYSTKNFKGIVDFSKLQPLDPFEPVLNAPKETNLYNRSFIDIPVGINYNLVRKDKIVYYVTLGVVGSKLVSSRNEITTGLLNSDPNVDATYNRYNNFLVSTKIGIGTLIKTYHIGINIEPQMRIFATKVHQSGIKENPVHFGIQVSLLKL